MRRLAAALLLLILLLGAGLWIGPRFLDWEPWRGRLAEIASFRLGRSVTLDGPVELVLLPQPMLRAAGVAIGEPGEEYSVTARLLRLRLRLGALLTGRIEPREIALVGAELTLPWPPGSLLALRPPPWITELEAEVEDSRVRLGAVVLEEVNATLSAGGPAQALTVAGAFTTAGRNARFSATLGRPGWDGIATFETTVTFPEISATARGALIPASGFEGTLQAQGRDLAALVPAPPGPFRASGRLSASAELIAADELTLDLGGAPARGAVAIRLLPAPRLDIALQASRLELDGWTRALRSATPRAWPVSLDLSAEAASWRGVTLRRLRGAAFLEDGRLTLSDISMLLPGDTELELAGATAAGRLELAARFAGQDLRATLAAFGYLTDRLDPAVLRTGEGRLRLVLEEAQAAIPELTATLDGMRISGAGVLRQGPRPALGLGLTLDRLRVDRWIPTGLSLAEAGRALSGFDVNLRLAADEVTWGSAVMQRAALDAALEGGRMTLRRLSGRLAEADLAASAVLALSGTPRLQELTLEANGPSAAGLLRLLPGGPLAGTALARQPIALRLAANGAPEALQIRGGIELGELRIEGSGTLDALQRRGTASVTLRHPGAPRLLAETLDNRVGDWLGEGSFSLVATLGFGPATLSAESFELVAGSLRARGSLSRTEGGARPRYVGRLFAERLPLPFSGWRAPQPLGLEALAGFDAELALEAASVEFGGRPTLEATAATLRLAEGRLVVDGLAARLGGGGLEGVASLDVTGETPRLVATLRTQDVTIAGPLFGLPFDLAAGRVEGRVQATAVGHSMAALLATLEGEAAVALRDGVVTGFDLGAASAATALAETGPAEAAIRKGLTSGATAFDRLELAGRLVAGRLVLGSGRLASEGGLAASISGEADLARGTLDLLIAARPQAPEAPDLGLRLTGPASAPRPLVETAAWARWRAEQP